MKRYEESSKLRERSDAVVESTDGEWVEYTEAAAEIARLNHQHANDEAANRMLSEACARLRERTILECAALFSGGMRNREFYVNDVEEMILGLLKGSVVNTNAETYVAYWVVSK